MLAFAEEVAEGVAEREFAQTEVGGVVDVRASVVSAHHAVVVFDGNEVAAFVDVHAETAVSRFEVVGLSVCAGIAGTLADTHLVEIAFGEGDDLTADTSVDEEVEVEVLEAEGVGPRELVLRVEVACISAEGLAHFVVDADVASCSFVHLVAVDGHLAAFINIDIASLVNNFTSIVCYIVAPASEVRHIEVAVSLAYAIVHLHLTSGEALNHFLVVAVLVLVGLLDLVVVVGEVDVGLPTPVLVDGPVVTEREFHTLVADETAVDGLRLAVHTCDIEVGVVHGGVVVGHIGREGVVEELHFQTRFKRFGLFGDGIEAVVCAGGCAASGCIRTHGVVHAVGNGVTYFRITQAILGIGEPFGQAEQLAQHGAGTETEVAVVVASTEVGELLEHAVPVAAVGTVDVDHFLPTELCGEEGCLVPVAALTLARHAVPTARGVEIVGAVGDTRLHAVGDDGLGGTAQVGAGADPLDGVAHPTCCGRYAPIFLERLVIGEEVVGIDFVVAAIAEVVRTIAIHIGGAHSCGHTIAFFAVLGMVDGDACLEGEAVVDVNLARELGREAVFALRASVHLGQPVGVVAHGILVNPLLRHVVEFHAAIGGGVRACGLIHHIVEATALVARHPGHHALVVVVVVLIVSHVGIARSEVEVVDGVTHRTTAHTVLRLRLAVVSAHVDGHAVPELVVLAEGEGVTVVRILGDETVGMAVGKRYVGAHLLRTARDAQRVVRVDTRLEEVGHVVGTIAAQVERIDQAVLIVLGWHGHVVREVATTIETATPAVRAIRGDVACCIVAGSTIEVLNFWREQGLAEGHVGVETYVNLTFLTLLGGNHDDTVGCCRTIKGCGVSTLEHVHALDVVGVNHGEGVGTFARGGVHELCHVANLSARVVRHGHTVHYDEGRVVTQDGLVTTEHDFRSATSATRRGRNGHTRNLTFHGVHEVGVLHLHEVVGLNLLRGVGQRLLLAHDTHGGHHGLVEAVAFLGEGEGEGIARPLLLLSAVANQGDANRLAILGTTDGEVTILVGCCCTLGTYQHNDSAHEGFAFGRYHFTFNHTVLLNDGRFCPHATRHQRKWYTDDRCCKQRKSYGFDLLHIYMYDLRITFLFN